MRLCGGCAARVNGEPITRACPACGWETVWWSGWCTECRRFTMPVALEDAPCAPAA